MRYLASVIDDRTGSATSEEMDAIDAFNDAMLELVAKGSRARNRRVEVRPFLVV